MASPPFRLSSVPPAESVWSPFHRSSRYSRTAQDSAVSTQHSFALTVPPSTRTAETIASWTAKRERRAPSERQGTAAEPRPNSILPSPTRLECTSDTGSVTVRAPKQVYTEKWAAVAEMATRARSLSGDCVSPIPILAYARIADGPEEVREVLQCPQSVRCRKCPQCRSQQARMWTARGMTECESAPRTWFSTLTFDWRSTPQDTMEKQWRFAQRSLTLFFKRLRKKGCKFRYLAVYEAHRDGRPHIHVLLHERPGSWIPWKTIDSTWTHGFHKTKLADGPRVAGYLTKYLFKNPGLCRVRASIRYGSGTDKDRSLTSSDIAKRETRSLLNRNPARGAIPTLDGRFPPHERGSYPVHLKVAPSG